MKTPTFVTLAIMAGFTGVGRGQPSISQQPADQSVSLGANVTFQVHASGSAPLSYQWSFDIAVMLDATNYTLSLPDVQLTNAGDYSVIVSDSSGSVTSRVAHLEVDPTFTKITQGAIVNDVGQLFVRGVWADFNNDGFLDVFVNDKMGTNVFYTNNGDGTFTKITQGPQVQGADNHSLPSWVDYDNDGNFDLTVPVGFSGSAPGLIQLYSNDGSGTFNRASAVELTTRSGYFGLGAWADYDNDGFVDFVVTSIPQNSTGGNLLFHNNGNGTFTKISSNPITTESLAPESLVWSDYDNDGFMDLLVVNSSDGFNRLYHNNRNSTFTRVLTNSIAVDQWGGRQRKRSGMGRLR
jgi:hypothetical protein